MSKSSDQQQPVTPVHDAAYFHCPRCEQRTWLRMMLREDRPVVDYGEPRQCKHCGRRLTELESMATQCGGACLTGWCFTCEQCGRDTFIDIVISEDQTERYPTLPKACSERPPTTWPCQHCGQVYRLELQD